jgi:lipopolysaccharide/colanic/teichoic acid biosynthesis glycosyltransferase
MHIAKPRGPVSTTRRSHGARIDVAAKRGLDVVVAAALLLALSPLIVLLALATKIDGRGPVLYRCRRVGHQGSTLAMLKFRKMRDDVPGPPLTRDGDARLTRVGRFLAGTKCDEIPQLWNVIRGEMSLVGPRPEDPDFVAHAAAGYALILDVKPGITGLSQLAFAREARILDPHAPVPDYLERLLPQKMALDLLYVARRSILLDLRILGWTAIAIVLRREVAVDRTNARLSLRRRPARVESLPAPVPSTADSP